jgi:mannosyltransferase OCH1-like enzyme
VDSCVLIHPEFRRYEQFLSGELRVIPRIIHQKTSRGLSPEERRLAHRMRTLLPRWEYRVWNDKETEALVGDRFPQYLSAFRSIRRGVVKADIARCVCLFVYGGFYFDTDYKLLHPIDEGMLSHTCVLPISRNSDSLFRLGTAVLGSEPNHPFWKDLVEHIFSHDQLSDLAEADVEKTTGPEALTSFYLERRELYKDIFVPPREVFHPLITCMGFTFQGGGSTIGAHLCWGSWRTRGPLGNLRNVAVRKLTSLY